LASGGLLLYLNYSRDTSPTRSILSASALQTITGQSMQNATSVTYSPTQNTDVSQLSTTPYLSDVQTTISFSTPASLTVDVPVVQFAIKISDLSGSQTVIPPGYWDLNLYAKANTNNDENNIGLRYWLIGRTSGGVYTNLIANGSDLNYLYDSATSQVITLSLLNPSPIDITGYEELHIVLTSRNRNANAHTAQIYFQSSNTYSHLHTSFVVQGPAGTSGTSGVGFNAISNYSNNRVLTSDGTVNSALAETNLTFDGNLLNVDGGIKLDYIDFDTNIISASPSRLNWDNDLGTINVGLTGGNVNVPIGLGQFTQVFNAESNTLNKGEVVYIFGAQGDKVSVKRASNLSELTSSKTLGVVSESIVSGQIGYVTTQGVISGLDLQSYNTGDLVWLGSDSGTYTSVKAQAPNHLVFVGVVLRNNQGNGQLFVKPQNGYELSEIHDVYISGTPSNGQTIAWNTTNTRWELSSQSLSKVLLVGNTASTSINMSGNDLTNIDEISTTSTNMKLQDILNSTLIFYSNNC
jgi:hypothetical protein